MKHLAVLLAAAVICCLAFSVVPASADTLHAPEDMFAYSDYLVISPEYNSSSDIWELWIMSYRIGSANRTGTPDTGLDQCVSACRIPTNDPDEAAGRIGILLGQAYEVEDMLEMEDIRYYMFYEFGKKCYLASPGGEFTTLSPVTEIEIHETRTTQRIFMRSYGTNPGFMLLCQLWQYSSRYGQIPVSVTKIYGFDDARPQSLYSGSSDDYCSNQEQLQRWCDSLIPETNSITSWDPVPLHGSTDIKYRKGGVEMCVGPCTDGLFITVDSNIR